MGNRIDPRIDRLYRSTLIWDTHSGFMPDPAADLSNLRIWKDAGVTHLSINVGFDLMPWQDTVTTLAVFRKWLADHADDFVLSRTASDVSRAKAEGKMSITFDLEGMNALNGRVEMVSFYHDLGVRQMLFAYNRNNLAGGGCHDEDTGLTAFGREVIDEMNRLGMFVDVSHSGYRTSMEVMEYSRRPVIFSHSNARAVYAHGRNISDEQIRACAATGGIVGATGIGLFLGGSTDTAVRLADHVEHLISVAGPEHVGIGLDYGFPVEVADLDVILANNPEFWPESEGYHDSSMTFVAPAQIIDLAAELDRRGHEGATIQGVIGENFLKLANEMWR
jgi:membrane dipeptidase